MEMTYTTEDVFVKNSLVTSADVYCDIIHGVFFVRVVKILVIREQRRRREQHREWWQRDEE
jgi:preprotein translocase subunit YajC